MALTGRAASVEGADTVKPMFSSPVLQSVNSDYKMCTTFIQYGKHTTIQRKEPFLSERPRSFRK